MNIYDEQKWGVLIIGPDDIFAAKSFEEAAEKASEINKMITDHIKPKCTNPNYPVVFAQVDKWENITSSEHDPLDTDWENAFS
jgi:hypothetical protein